MKNSFFSNNYFNHAKVVEALLRHGQINFDPINDLFYGFNGRNYVVINETYLLKKISYMIGEDIALVDVKKVLDFFKLRVSITGMGDASPRRGFVNLENGILNVKTRELSPHSAKYIYFNTVPVFYDRNAVCKNWLIFIDQIFLRRECLIKVMQEIFGYCLISGNWLQIAFILFGEGANGKSTLLEILRALLGNENTSSLSMKDLSSTFRAIELMNKLVSISDESPTGNNFESDIFKSLVGGGTIMAEKKFKNPIHFKNGAKLIFATNKLPSFKDHSFGFYRRI